QSLPKRRNHAGLPTASFEIGARLEYEHQARIGLAEFLQGYCPGTSSWVIEGDPFLPEPFHHQEVIKIPEHNVGRLHSPKGVHVRRITLGGHAIPSGRLQQM